MELLRRKKLKILLTGGGTAGHVMPHIAMLDLFRKNYDGIVYIGSENGIEKSIIEAQKDIAYYPITTTKFVRRKIFKNLLIPFKLIRGIHESKRIIKAEKPSVVFSKGGFVSLPVVIAAKRLKVPVVAHESDLYMGLANKLSRRSASVICTTFSDTADREKKAIFTGSPMRRELLISKDDARKKLGIVTSKPVLVVTGGSLGSRFINSKVFNEIKPLTSKFYVIHIVGKNNLDPHLKNISDYKQIEFASDMGPILASADIVVSRAGSNTIFELGALKKPMLLIPLPKGNSRGDQVDNAKYFNKMGYANFVFEQQLENDNLLFHIEKTLKDSPKLVKNLKDANFTPANEKIMEIILKNSKKE